jgi:tRNA (guanine37-N1)-methyltransferase
MKIQVITLFPDEFLSLVDLGVTGRAIRDQVVDLQVLNPREFAQNKHRSVDDRPYGGGPGMVMTLEPLRSTIRQAKASAARYDAGGSAAEVRVSLLSPQGQRLDQAAIQRLAQRSNLILVCGRYEGLDERLIESEIDEEWSIGDYVLSGGELAAAVMIDAVVRLLPGVLGDESSADQDSFSEGLLDCPHYTRPESVDGREVPAVLLSGDHQAIARWRRKQSLGRTQLRRPDLLEQIKLNARDQALLDEFMAENGTLSGAEAADKTRAARN